MNYSKQEKLSMESATENNLLIWMRIYAQNDQNETRGMSE